jgi:phenylalanyl-tRNA synthetase beta subunit
MKVTGAMYGSYVVAVIGEEINSKKLCEGLEDLDFKVTRLSEDDSSLSIMVETGPYRHDTFVQRVENIMSDQPDYESSITPV